MGAPGGRLRTCLGRTVRGDGGSSVPPCSAVVLGGLRIHAAQLALNAAWPAAFFSARGKRLSLGVIVALDALVAAELAVAARDDTVAAGLLAPYLAWCLFATALNATVTDPALA